MATGKPELVHQEGGRYYDRDSRAGGEQERDRVRNIIGRYCFCVLALHSELASTQQSSASKTAATEVGERTGREWNLYTGWELAVLVVNIGKRYVRDSEVGIILLRDVLPSRRTFPRVYFVG